MRTRAIAIALALAAAGCTTTRTCKDQTLLVTISFDGPASGADAVVIGVSIDGAPEQLSPSEPVSASSGTVEVDFPHGYPAGKSVRVRAEAHKGGSTLASTSNTTALTSNCGTLSLSYVAGNGDGGTNSDGADACTPATTCPQGTLCGKISDGCGGMIDCGGCQLYSIDAPLSAASDTLFLEGLFQAPATVNFPGGASAPATVLGRSRASVLVPTGATEGPLTVTANGSTTGALNFHRASYSIGLQSFLQDFPQVEHAQMMPQTQLATWGIAAIATTSRIWAIGGTSVDTGLTSVEEARLNADGTLGAFAPLATKLGTGRMLHTATRIGDFIYVVGGRDANHAGLKSVERAQIMSNGSLGPWSDAGVKLTVSRWAHATAIVGSYVYVFGGNSGNQCTQTPVASIERAPILPDGSLGAFADAGKAFAHPRQSHAVVLKGSTVYALGGTVPNPSVEQSPVTPDGDLLGFAPAANLLPAAQSGGGGVAWAGGGKLYYAVGSGQGSVQSATINADGSLGAFADAKVNADAYNSSLVFFDNYLYLIGGGFSDCSVCSACAQYAPIGNQRAWLDAGQGLGTFTILGNESPVTPRSGYGTIAIGSTLYLLGGVSDPAKTFESATIAPDGTLGPFTALTGGFQTARTGALFAVAGDRVYALGGFSGGNKVLSVEVASIMPDGTLGAFANAMSGGVGYNLLDTGSVAWILGQNLCVGGGALTCAAPCTGGASVQCAPLNPDGTLSGGFAAVSNSTLASGPSVVLAAEGNLFIFDVAVGGAGAQTATYKLAGPRDPTYGTLNAAFSSYAAAGTGGLPGMSGFLAGNALYFLGGFGGLGDTSTTHRSLVDPLSFFPGMIGNAPVSIATPQSGGGTVVIGNWATLIAGHNMGLQGDTEQAELH